MLTFTNIQHGFRKRNGLSNNEYILCDMIFYLSSTAKSHFGWCYMTRENIAEDLGISKSGVIKMIERMIENGFLERDNLTKYLKTSEMWQEVYLDNHSKKTDGVQSVPSSVQSVPNLGVQSNPYNNRTDNNSIIKKELNCEKAVSLNLFGAEIVEDEKAKKMMFKNSLVSVFEIFDKKFVAEEYKNVDINYYFYAVADWSLQKSTKVLRTNEGWIATARTWIRNDFKAGKLKVKSNSNEQEQYLEYLKDSNASD